MSIPLFPSLRPNIVSPFWCDLDPPIDEEAEILELEREQREWKASIGQMFSDVIPVGKTTHDIEEEDLDEMGEEEDDTTSSDVDDDMEDDDGDPSALFHVHDHSALEATATTADGSATTPTATDRATDTPQNAAPVEAAPHSSTSSDSSISEALHAPSDSADAINELSDPQSVRRPRNRPTRAIAGRHFPTQRSGIRPQPVRVAYIDPSGRPVYTGHSSTGSVSPTSRAYIDAALQSPTGEVNLDITDDQEVTDSDHDRDTSTHQSIHFGRPIHGARQFPDSASDHVNQYHQMVAAGQIRPSVSSAQIDNLIESMHQAQRAHASRTTAPENEPVTALAEAILSNVGGLSGMEASSDNNDTFTEEL